MALDTPGGGEYDAVPTQPFGKTLSDLREAFAVGIVPRVRVSPMDREMGNQGKADQFCKLDRLDNVGGLRDRNVAGAANTVAPWRRSLRLLIGLCCTGA